eukprot:m.109029 g.109029  ORF g.109029 m.109029 type:complete len:577 (+) comp9027_c0_seq1:33-1763(+)
MAFLRPADPSSFSGNLLIDASEHGSSSVSGAHVEVGQVPQIRELSFSPAAAADSDPVTPSMAYDVLKFHPEELAKQITLLDIEIFRRIQPEELMNGVWLSKEKFDKAPNVVAFTRRFNHVSFWVTKEILSAPTQAVRVDRLVHFVKLAKRLCDANNIHSLLAVVSGLRSAPIYRLSQTWKSMAEKYAQRFEKLEKFVSEAENYKQIREMLSTARLPCIPHLGLYLTDLMHLQAHLRPGESERKVSVITDDLKRFQASEYSYEPVYFIREYLLSIKYSEGLLKLIEDENYRISLEIEPKHSESRCGVASDFEKLEKTFAKLELGKGSFPARLRPQHMGHRKSKSLGNGTIFGSFRGYQSLQDEEEPTTPPMSALPAAGTRFTTPPPSPAVTSSATSSSAAPSSMKGSPVKACESDSDCSEDDIELSVTPTDGCPHLSQGQRIEREGMLRRRTSSKLRPVKRQWVQLAPPDLLLFSGKHSGNRAERSAYKEKPSLVFHLEDFSVVGESGRPEFKLVLENPPNTLRFICETADERDRWVRVFQRVIAPEPRSARGSIAAPAPMSVPAQRPASRVYSQLT